MSEFDMLDTHRHLDEIRDLLRVRAPEAILCDDWDLYRHRPVAELPDLSIVFEHGYYGWRLVGVLDNGSFFATTGHDLNKTYDELLASYAQHLLIWRLNERED